MTASFLAGVREGRLTRPDGRVVAWSEYGDPAGIPLLRMPGTPGCRYTMRADRSPWDARGLFVVTTERPGYGASTVLPGRGFAEHADDVAAILDSLGLDRVHVIGGSGAAPHELAFAARHPDRVRAVTVLVGAAPATDEEYAALVGINAQVHEMHVRGEEAQIRVLLAELREKVLADVLGTVAQLQDKAPESDRRVMTDPLWQQAQQVAWVEALAQGVDGWADEGYAIDRRWDDVDVESVRASVTWWHGAADANAPLSAAQRLVARLPDARLELFAPTDGHFAAYHREGEILDELLARG